MSGLNSNGLDIVGEFKIYAPAFIRSFSFINSRPVLYSDINYLVNHNSNYSVNGYQELHLSGILSSIELSDNYFQINGNSSLSARYTIPSSIRIFYFYLNYSAESRLQLSGSTLRSLTFHFILSSTSGTTPYVLLFNNLLTTESNFIFKFEGGSHIGVVLDHVYQDYPSTLSGGIYQVPGGSNVFLHLVSSESQCSSNPEYIGNRHFCFVSSSVNLGYFSSFEKITVEGDCSSNKLDVLISYPLLPIYGIGSSAKVAFHFLTSNPGEIAANDVVISISSSLVSTVSIFSVIGSSTFSVDSNINLGLLIIKNYNVLSTILNNVSILNKVDRISGEIPDLNSIAISQNQFSISISSDSLLIFSLLPSLKSVFLLVNNAVEKNIELNVQSSTFNSYTSLNLLSLNKVNIVKGTQYLTTNHPLINFIDDEENVKIPYDIPNVQAIGYGFSFEYGVDSISDYCANSVVLPIPSDICRLRYVNVLPNALYLPSNHPLKITYWIAGDVIESPGMLDTTLLPNNAIVIFQSRDTSNKYTFKFGNPSGKEDHLGWMAINYSVEASYVQQYLYCSYIYIYRDVTINRYVDLDSSTTVWVYQGPIDNYEKVAVSSSYSYKMSKFVFTNLISSVSFLPLGASTTQWITNYTLSNGTIGTLTDYGKPFSFDMKVSTYHTVYIYQTFSGVISQSFGIMFRSSTAQKVSLKNYARFGSIGNFSVGGNQRILLLVDDQSGSGYTLSRGFSEYLPPNDANVKVSIWYRGVGSCSDEQYCLFENDVFKVNPSSNYSFEINGNCRSFVLDLSNKGLRLINDCLTISSTNFEPDLNVLTVLLPSDKVFLKSEISGVTLLYAPNSPVLMTSLLTVSKYFMIIPPTSYSPRIIVHDKVIATSNILISEFTNNFAPLYCNFEFSKKVDVVEVSDVLLSFLTNGDASNDVNIQIGKIYGKILINYLNEASVSDYPIRLFGYPASSFSAINTFEYRYKSTSQTKIQLQGNLDQFNYGFIKNEKISIIAEGSASFDNTIFGFDLWVDYLNLSCENSCDLVPKIPSDATSISLSIPSQSYITSSTDTKTPPPASSYTLITSNEASSQTSNEYSTGFNSDQPNSQADDSGLSGGIIAVIIIVIVIVVGLGAFGAYYVLVKRKRGNAEDDQTYAGVDEP